MSEEWFNSVQPKFHELVNDIATRYPCNVHEVLDVCSEWLSRNSMNIGELGNVLQVYGHLRGIGQDHATVIVAMRPFAKAATKKRVVPNIRLIRED